MQPFTRPQSFGRLFQMRLPEIVFRGKQETWKLVDRIRSITIPDDNRWRDVERFSRFLENAEEAFFPGALEANVASMLAEEHADECQSLLASADRAFRGTFDLLGYRDLSFGDPVDWHLDGVSGRRAPFVHWSRIDPLDAASIGDSKVIWELNRHQWLVRLGQAWQLTRDERYAEAIVRHLQDWIRRNPAGMGINWASSLEVSFRLISWCWTLLLMRDARALTPELYGHLEDVLAAHAAHVEKYLSYYFSPNTHLTGEALGLVYAGVLFPWLKRSQRWQAVGSRILIDESRRQILPDGVYFEQSTCYQRYTIDLYLHFLILAERARIDVPPAIGETLRAMLDVLIALRQPDGSMPSIGDEDGGFVMPLSTADAYDYRATFSTAAVVLGDGVSAWAAGSVSPETLWLLGSSAAERFRSLQQVPPPAETCKVFPDGGLVVMRSGWDRDAHSLIFDAGPLGCHFSSGHGHADLLGIQCSAFGTRYIVDAGTCCYTADETLRNYFRGTAAHSTVMIDGKPQAQPAGPFSWHRRCAAQLLRWGCGEPESFAEAEHDAYRTLPDPVTHRRRIVFVGSRYWIVVDDLEGATHHHVDVRFQFVPMDVREGEDGWIRAARDGERGLLLRAFSSARLETRICEGLRQPMQGWISRRYGHAEPAPAVVYSTIAQLPLRLITVLWPAEDIGETPTIDVTSFLSSEPQARSPKP